MSRGDGKRGKGIGGWALIGLIAIAFLLEGPIREGELALHPLSPSCSSSSSTCPFIQSALTPSALAQPGGVNPGDPAALKVRRRGKDRSEMVFIEAGEFTMGRDRGDPAEGPAHRVYLRGYWIDRYEVTNAQYLMFMEETHRPPPSCWNTPKLNELDQPVVGVSWEDAAAYAKWAGKRLPTEAEWEKAARGGGKESAYHLYPWGNAWDERRVNSREAGRDRTLSVSSLPEGASPYGLLHMAGNAAEWVADWYDPDYYSRSPERDPRGPEQGIWKVVRGGGWWCRSEQCQVTHRRKELPTARTSSIGFRCAMDE
jgi:iron(II)-dependent oxidoreductase